MIKHNPLLLISLVVLLLVSSPCQAAIEFDGNNDYVDATSNTFLNTANAYSISFWMKLDVFSGAGTSNYPGPFNFKTDQSTGFTCFLANIPGYEGINFGSDANFVALKTSGDISSSLVNSWRNVVITFNGVNRTLNSNYKIFINGSEVATTNSSAFAGVPNVNTLGKASTTSTYFNGKLDDIRIYNRALTASEIEVLYNSKRKRVGGSVANGMVAHYEMDGGEIGSAVSTVIDASGNSNHGTGNGGASLKFIEGVVNRN